MWRKCKLFCVNPDDKRNNGQGFTKWNTYNTNNELIEIKWNASLIQQGNFIDVFLDRHASGTYAHHQEH